MKVFTVAHIPDDLAQAWLQHLRDFDVAHAGCHFEIMAEAPDASLAEVIDRMRVEPGLSFTKVFELPK